MKNIIYLIKYLILIMALSPYYSQAQTRLTKGTSVWNSPQSSYSSRHFISNYSTIELIEKGSPRYYLVDTNFIILYSSQDNFFNIDNQIYFHNYNYEEFKSYLYNNKKELIYKENFRNEIDIFDSIFVIKNDSSITFHKLNQAKKYTINNVNWYYSNLENNYIMTESIENKTYYCGEAEKITCEDKDSLVPVFDDHIVPHKTIYQFGTNYKLDIKESIVISYNSEYKIFKIQKGPVISKKFKWYYRDVCRPAQRPQGVLIHSCKCPKDVYTYIDTLGNLLFPFGTIPYFAEFTDGYCITSDNKIINIDGKIIFEGKDKIIKYIINKNLFIFSKQRGETYERFGVSDFNNNIIIPPIYYSIKPTNNRLIIGNLFNNRQEANSSNYYETYCDYTGNMIIKTKFIYIVPTKEKVTLAFTNKNIYYINNQGSILAKFKYSKK